MNEFEYNIFESVYSFAKEDKYTFKTKISRSVGGILVFKAYLMSFVKQI